MSRYKNNFNFLKIIGIVFAILFIVALVAFLIISIPAAIKDISFSSLLNDWGINIGKETAESTAHLIFNM